MTNKLDIGNEFGRCVIYNEGEVKVKKKPLFVATMYNNYFFIMYTDKKAIEKEDGQNKDKKDEK